MSTGSSYTTTFATPGTPEVAFTAATQPHTWWNTMITGRATCVGDRFVYDVPDLHHSALTVTEAIPGKRLVWHVEKTGKPTELDEWVGTDLAFEFHPHPSGTGTMTTFTHHGLRPELDCHDVCTAGWNHHLTVGLQQLLTTGHAQPLTPQTVGHVATTIGATANTR